MPGYFVPENRGVIVGETWESKVILSLSLSPGVLLIVGTMTDLEIFIFIRCPFALRLEQLAALLELRSHFFSPER